MNSERDLGSQPVGELIRSWGLGNHDLVEASPEQLTHKQVQRAISGRRLTLKMMQKMARTLNFAVWGRLTDEEREKFEEYLPKQLFNYSKGWSEEEVDVNEHLKPAVQNRPMRRDFLRELGKDS